MKSTDNKPSRKKRLPVILTSIALVAAICLSLVYLKISSIAPDEGDAGILTEDIVGSTNKDVLYILVCGIDYDSDDENRSGVGLTDLIMVLCLDKKANTLTLLQIPRDTYVGEIAGTGGTAKINALYSNGEDTVNRISNLAKIINEQFGLPIDYYMTIDMRAFREIINTLGGIEMYVPWDVPVMNELGEQVSLIPQGTHRIDGATAEIIVRSRKGYAQGDLRRLEMQQYFYAALFRTFRTYPLSDIVKVMPMFSSYVNTNMSVAQLGSLAATLQRIDTASITVIRCPGGALGDVNGHTGLYGINSENMAVLLNDYMRPYSDDVPATELGLPTGLTFPYGEITDTVTLMGDLPTAPPEDVPLAAEGLEEITEGSTA